MSDQSVTSGADRFERLGASTRALLARVARAEARASASLKAAIDDAFLLPEARLDDRTRAALGELIAALVATIADEIADHAAELLVARGEAALADALDEDRAAIVARLADAGLLRDNDLMAECLARVHGELIAASLPVEAPSVPDTPSLLARLVHSSDRAVAAAALALLSGESHRTAPRGSARLAGTGMPDELHQRLLWWVAAALRERALLESNGAGEPLDRAIAEAALRAIAAHQGGDRVEAAAMRMASAIDAQADELPALLDEALRDRRVTLFAALVAHAMGVPYELARDVVLDPAGDRLWLILRALEVPRATIARIGYRLCQADRRRDIEVFADALDGVIEIDAADARAAIAPLRLHPEYRAAVAALARGA